MGRYYQGDIEGKFWFAVQSSDDATFFGGMETELYASDEDEEEENVYGAQYSFGADDMEDIEAGLATCKEELGEWKDKLDEFFNGGTSYSNDMIVKFMGLKGDDAELVVRGKLEWYARLILGEKIYNCVKENESCVFEGEY